MNVVAVDPESPLYGYIRPGYKILSVNGERIIDSIDFRYKTAEERLDLRFEDHRGRELDFQFYDVYPGDLGITLDDGQIKVCKCDCIFCFVQQQPRGMRETLYTKDEDYRLSFTHGNFVTLSNTTEEEIERIIEQRLSPMYVSVHVTDDTMRRCMLRNEKLAPIVPQLKYLSENGITIHTQVVLCPGINDGSYLEKTIDQLAALYPGVESLAVVPVGLTRYRQHLPDLRTYDKGEAAGIIDYVHGRQRELLRSVGSRFVWPADEFYVLAARPFPRLCEYEEMSQFENGIGMVREFITRFNRKRVQLTSLRSSKRALLLTGASSYPFLSREIVPYINETLGLKVDVELVKNRFWGESVTVSGLLTGQDLLRAARARLDYYDTVIVPPNCLNDDDLFLDNLGIDQFERVLGKPVVLGQYDLVATLKDVFQ